MGKRGYTGKGAPTVLKPIVVIGFVPARAYGDYGRRFGISQIKRIVDGSRSNKRAKPTLPTKPFDWKS